MRIPHSSQNRACKVCGSHLPKIAEGGAAPAVVVPSDDKSRARLRLVDVSYVEYTVE
jgi:hypothetical protein